MVCLAPQQSADPILATSGEETTDLLGESAAAAELGPGMIPAPTDTRGPTSVLAATAFATTGEHNALLEASPPLLATPPRPAQGSISFCTPQKSASPASSPYAAVSTPQSDLASPSLTICPTPGPANPLEPTEHLGAGPELRLDVASPLITFGGPPPRQITDTPPPKPSRKTGCTTRKSHKGTSSKAKG